MQLIYMKVFRKIIAYPLSLAHLVEINRGRAIGTLNSQKQSGSGVAIDLIHDI